MISLLLAVCLAAGVEASEVQRQRDEKSDILSSVSRQLPMADRSWFSSNG
jgi:hypothetical protein